MKTIQGHSLDTAQKKQAQNKIRNVVILYQRTNPEAYATVINEIANRRKLNLDRFASTRENGEHAVERALYEIPETMFAGILQNLDEYQLQYFKSKEGSRWFAKTFKMFSVADEI